MKFDCGLTKEEKQELDICRYSNWHEWFAWFPVQVGYRDCRWLEVIERKGRAMETWDGIRWNWEYRVVSNLREGYDD
jgi:hypothetical protein